MAKVTLEDFKRNWEEQIAKIEKEALDNESFSSIYRDFHSNKTMFKMGLSEKEFTHDVMLELDMLESKLRVALEIANSRFKLKNRGIIAKAFNGIFKRISPKKEKI